MLAANNLEDNTVFYYWLDDGRGDYNRSYEQYEKDTDYADYSTDHRDSNFFNFEKKIRKNKQQIINDAWKKFDD
ncbi:MAG: hypothetical protein GX084_03020 [Acholeplasmataceae bacterium]|nr:hypothetical protein [Acholeplasmataceae bacterium]